MDYVPWIMGNFSENYAVLTGLLPGIMYLVSVGAQNQVGTSPFSEVSTAVTNSPGEDIVWYIRGDLQWQI